MPTPLANGAGPRRGALPRALVVLLGAAATVVVVAGVRGIAWLIGPVFMALIIVIAVAPVQSWLRRRGWPGWATTVVLVLLVFSIMVSLALGIVLSIARLATELPQYASKADALVASAKTQLAGLGVGPEQLQQAASSLNVGNLVGRSARCSVAWPGWRRTWCSCWRCCCSSAWRPAASATGSPTSPPTVRRSSTRSTTSPGAPAGTCW